MEDKSGEPRSTEDLKEAVQIIERAIVQGSLEIPPALLIMLPTARDGLIELIKGR